MKLTIIISSISLVIGFYLGWHLHNERVTVGVLESINTISKIESSAIQSSIVASQSVEKQIQNENIREDKIRVEYKQIKATQETNILDTRLPDDVIGLLYTASRSETTSNTTKRDND